jgi:ATP-dependent Zn protease
MGASIPKGILFTGPPGIGKTHLAKAIANESDISLFYKSASEFEGFFIGSGAKRIREFFNSVRKELPAIVFIDEIDALGAKRSDSSSSFNR